jgi:hypothetical protein
VTRRGGPLLFANLGAEEGEGWPRMAAHPRVRAAARMWAASFGAGARAVGPAAPASAELAGALATDSECAALELCESLEGLVPWLSTAEAEALAAREGVSLGAAPASVVARVHDKAFALQVARERGLVSHELADTAFALAPEELEAPDTVRCRIEAAVARWPAALAEKFVLKPRFGTSGRGRLAGRAGRLDPEALRGNLPRLRERGGCVVEPWLERVTDLSAQLWIVGRGEVRLLGTFTQEVTPAGVPAGHRARVDPAGAVESGSRWDAELRASALALGAAAAEAGYTGPCGVDAFSHRAPDGGERFRAAVELNARFTAGTSALALIARARRTGLISEASDCFVGFGPSLVGGARIEIFADEPELALWLG